MRKKTLGAKRLLSLVLTIAMFATMILPTGVFAADNGTITTDLDEKTIVKDELVEFTVSSTKNEVGGTIMIKGKFEIEASNTDITSIEYYETTQSMEGWYPFTTNFDGSTISGEFGPEGTGFPMMDATSKFRIKFANAGIYNVTVSAVKVADGVELCSETVNVTVYDGSADYTELETAISLVGGYNANDYTTVSYKKLTDAVKAAEDAIDENWTSDKQSAVADLVEDINNAIAALEKLADYSELSVAYNAGKAITNDNGTYTAKTFKALTDALDEAAKDENKELTDQDEVDALTKAINEAIAGLVTFTDITFSATAVTSNVNDNYAKADKIVVVFSEPLATDVDTIKAKFNNTAIDSVTKNNESVYTLNLKENHELDNGLTLTLSPEESILTAAGKAINSCSSVVKGNVKDVADLVTANAMTATIVNVDDKPYIVDGDKIVLVFNAPVKGAAADIEEINVGGMIAKVVADTDNTIYEIELKATDTVVPGQELAYGDIKATLTGTFGGTVVPKVVRALISDEDGTAKTAGDKIYVFFSAPTNKVANAEETNFTGVLAGSTGKWLDNQTLVITLGNTVISITDKIVLSGLGIKDFYSTEDVDVDGNKNLGYALEGSFGTAIQPALLTLIAISKQGKGAPSAGDEIHLAFNVKMREDDLNLQNNFDFNYGDYGTGAKAAWAKDDDHSDGDEYAEYSTIIITLGEGANVVPGTTKITIENIALFEESGTKCCEVSNLENRIVTGTFGASIAPELLSASIVKTKPVVGPQNGDQIVLLFNVPTNGENIDNLIKVGSKSLGTGYEGNWNDDKTVYTIELGSAPTVAGGDTIEFDNDGTLKDRNNQKQAKSNSVKISGSFGEEANPVGISPSKVTATIVKTTTAAGPQKGDKIVFAYNVATNGSELMENFFSAQGNKFGDGLTGGWNEAKTIYTLILGEGATIADGADILFTATAGIQDKDEINSPVTSLECTLIGSFGEEIKPVTAAPALLDAVIVKVSNTAGAQKDDTIKLVFDIATNKSEKLFADLNVDDLFGAGARGEWNTAGTVYTITLGTDATIVDATKLKITTAAELKDKSEYSAFAEQAGIELIGSFGTAATPVANAPKVLEAVITKKANTAGAQKDDTIKLVFDIVTNKSEKLFADLNVDDLFGAGARGEWNTAGTVYTITLGTDATIVDATKLKITTAAELKDKSEYSAFAEQAGIELTGSFGEEIKVKLQVIGAVAYSDADSDYIDIEFNTEISDNISETIFKEATVRVFGTGFELTRNKDDVNILTIKLGSDYSITKGYVLEFSDKDEHLLTGVNGEKLANSAVVELVGELRKPYVTSVIANYNEGTGVETLTVTFSSKTNKPENIDLSAQYSSLGIGATAAWTDAKTLVITLGEGRAISLNGTGGIVLNGLGITNGFDTNEVVGQYSITSGTLKEENVLKVVDARVNRKAVDADTTADFLTVTFSVPTNMYGKALNTGFNLSDIEANIVASKTFGTDATAKWESTSKLVIKLGADSTFKNPDDTNLADSSTVKFKNLKFVNGFGAIVEEEFVVTGSFDGRETKLNNLDVVTEGEYTTATVTVDKQDLDYTEEAIITFVIWDAAGIIVTDINAIKLNMTAVDEIEVSSKFEVKDYSKVEVYVTDEYIDAIGEDTEFKFLAETVVKDAAAE